MREFVTSAHAHDSSPVRVCACSFVCAYAYVCMGLYVLHFACILTLQQKFQVGQAEQQLLLPRFSLLPDSQQFTVLPHAHVLFLTLTCVGFCRRHRLIIPHNMICSPKRTKFVKVTANVTEKLFHKLDKCRFGDTCLPMCVCMCVH